MNKIILSIVLIFGFTQAFSQKIVGGIRFDTNLSHFILSDFNEVNSKRERGNSNRGNSVRNKRGFGLSMGGFTKIDFTENFALRPELLLHYKTSKMDEKKFETEASFQYFGVEIPIHAIFQANSRRCFIGTGAYFGFGIDARYKFDNKDYLNLYKENNGLKSEMNRFDFGIASIIGHNFFNSRFQIVITCKVGLINILNANKDNSKIRLHTLSLGLGYRLN